MFDGKKNTSYRIFYTALDLVGQKMAKEEKTPLEIWKNALEKVTPQVEVKSRRIGGATFQVPTEIRADRKESISMKNLIISHASVAARPWPTNSLLKSWMLTTSKAARSSVKKICTAWQKLTAHSLTLDFN